MNGYNVAELVGESEVYRELSALRACDGGGFADIVGTAKDISDPGSALEHFAREESIPGELAPIMRREAFRRVLACHGAGDMVAMREARALVRFLHTAPTGVDLSGAHVGSDGGYIGSENLSAAAA